MISSVNWMIINAMFCSIELSLVKVEGILGQYDKILAHEAPVKGAFLFFVLAVSGFTSLRTSSAQASDGAIRQVC